MATKVADRYLKVDPWKVIEEGFEHPRSRVSESMFCLANEYMGVRGYFDEGYSGDRLLGSYFNNLYETKTAAHPQHFKGIVTRECFGVNSVDNFYTRITLDGEVLDLAKVKFSAFLRTLNMSEGTMERSFVWTTKNGKKVKCIFERFLSMSVPYMVCQRVSFTALNFTGAIQIKSGLDFSIIHEIASGWSQTKVASSTENAGKNFWTVPKMEHAGDSVSVIGKTINSGHLLYSSFRIDSSTPIAPKFVRQEKIATLDFSIRLVKDVEASFDKIITNFWEKSDQIEKVWSKGAAITKKNVKATFKSAHAQQKAYWVKAWDMIDMPIEGDPENQQGLRFSLFNLYQTYHGFDAGLNVPCKGLTAEVYYGAIFWDTETYCMPFYMLNNPKAARNLILYRHKYLPQAVARAKELDCEGARYPMITLDGTESCATWQHGDFEIHVSVAISYAIWMYTRTCQDTELLYKEGIEMLLQISRFYASWGEYSPKNGDFCLYGVMGPDEYHMNVNNNVYTNVMAKKSFEFTLEVAVAMQKKAPDLWKKVAKKVALRDDELANWKKMAKKMRIPMDVKTGLLEQHDGYFDLPEVDVKNLPEDQIPIYKNWSYVRIFRYNMVKQPDSLLLHLFYSKDYPIEQKKINYDYYEARTIHESSLSPGIHSILAAELGMKKEADEFFQYMTRLDLDNYNKNTDQGLHVTSMSGAYLNILYGYGGFRSDYDKLFFAPSIPAHWKSLSFKMMYRGSVLKITIDQKNVTFEVVSGKLFDILVYGEKVVVSDKPTVIKLIPLGVKTAKIAKKK